MFDVRRPCMTLPGICNNLSVGEIIRFCFFVDADLDLSLSTSYHAADYHIYYRFTNSVYIRYRTVLLSILSKFDKKYDCFVATVT